MGQFQSAQFDEGRYGSDADRCGKALVRLEANLTELPKPKLERDPDAPSKYRLTFDVQWPTGLWTNIFQGEAGGHHWPHDLPQPRYEDARIEARGLEYRQIPQFVECLRGRIASTEGEIERQRPEREAREQAIAAEVKRREDEFSEAERIIDELFE